MTGAGSPEEGWRALRTVLESEELLLGMRASDDPACRWFVALALDTEGRGDG